MAEPTKKCARCGRALHSDVGIALGMGPVCFGKRVKNPTWKEFESLGQLRLFGEVPLSPPTAVAENLEENLPELGNKLENNWQKVGEKLGPGWGKIWARLKSIKLD